MTRPCGRPAGMCRAGPETRFQAASRLWESGQRPRARALFLSVAQDQGASDYVRVQSALTLAPTLSQPERTTLQTAMRPLLARLVETGNYLELLDVARILRALRSTENLDLLMTLLDRTQADFGSQETPFIATLAIRDLGPVARRTAAERLLAGVEMARAERVSGEPELQLLALAWLGDRAQLQKNRRAGDGACSGLSWALASSRMKGCSSCRLSGIIRICRRWR